MTVRVASSDNPDVTVAPAVLTFTGGAGGNWNTAQAVTVHAGADDNGVGETVPVTDDDPRAVVVDTDPSTPATAETTTLAVAEPGTGTYTVRLNTEPDGVVTVGIADTTSNADVSVSPSALEFSAADWNTAPAVTVSAAVDADAADDTATLRHTVTGTVS